MIISFTQLYSLGATMMTRIVRYSSRCNGGTYILGVTNRSLTELKACSIGGDSCQVLCTLLTTLS